MCTTAVCRVKGRKDVITLFSERDLLEVIEESMGFDVTNYLKEILAKYKQDKDYAEARSEELDQELRRRDW